MSGLSFTGRLRYQAPTVRGVICLNSPLENTRIDANNVLAKTSNLQNFNFSSSKRGERAKALFLIRKIITQLLKSRLDQLRGLCYTNFLGGTLLSSCE